MIIKTIEIKEQKTDRNRKPYRPCIAEFEGESGSYWHNIYLSTDVVNNWRVGDDVAVKLKNDGKWKNFDPVIEKSVRPTQPTPISQSNEKGINDWVGKGNNEITQILARLNAVEKKQTEFNDRLLGIEGELNDQENEGRPF